MSSLIFGPEKLCQVVMRFICLAWPPYAGLYGRPGTGHALRKKLIINSNEVIYSACLFMPYWVRLYKGEMQDKVKDGADVLMKVALSIGEGPSLGTGRRMITDERVQDPEDGDVVQGFAGQASRGSDPEDMSF
jgi:hypothetical protein